MDKVLYYDRITSISIIKSSSDIYNKEKLLVSGSSSQKVRSSSYNENGEEETINTFDPESNDSDMFESMSYLV